MTEDLKRAFDTHQSRWAELGFEGLTEKEKNYVGIYWLSAEVNNGGFDQFFYNSSGDLTEYARRGLTEINAVATLRLLDEAIGLIPLGFSLDQDTRQERLLMIPDGEDPFDSVTRRFYNNAETFEDMHLADLAIFYSQTGKK